jgi:iron complex transport system substrate-binding protein
MPGFLWAQDMTRKVTDMEQQEVTLPAQIRKVATIGSVPPLNSLMFAIGAGDMLVNGLPEPFSRGLRWKYQAVFSPAIVNKPKMQGPSRPTRTWW